MLYDDDNSSFFDWFLSTGFFEVLLLLLLSYLKRCVLFCSDCKSCNFVCSCISLPVGIWDVTTFIPVLFLLSRIAYDAFVIVLRIIVGRDSVGGLHGGR